MCVCVCVCVYVCVCMYVYVCKRVYVCMCMCVSVCMYVGGWVGGWVCVSTCMCVHVWCFMWRSLELSTCILYIHGITKRRNPGHHMTSHDAYSWLNKLTMGSLSKNSMTTGGGDSRMFLGSPKSCSCLMMRVWSQIGHTLSFTTRDFALLRPKAITA